MSILAAVESRGADSLTEPESAEIIEVADQLKAARAELKQIEERIEQLGGDAPVRPASAAAVPAYRQTHPTGAALAVRNMHVPRATIGREPMTYDQGTRTSYFADLIRHRVGMDDGSGAERLRRHAEEVASTAEYRDLSRTDGNGGYFVPPLWLMSQFIELARAGRAYANLCTSQPLPPGTDTINIPKVATGASTAIQTADNAAVSETDLTDTSVPAPVRTIAGQQDVAIQLLDQSPVSFDEVIFRDLTADYATKVDLQVISGTGGSGQVTGIRATSGIVTVAYTDASPTVAELYSKLADAVQRVHTARFMPPTVIVMHPRRWAWFLAASDSTGRPLVVPNAGNPQNAAATLGVVGSQQVVGQMHGLPVVTDPSMPITLGAGTNEDVIHVLRASDLLLFESGLRSRVLPEVGSGTLTVRLQVYGYLAFTAGRYPQSIVELGGSGLVQPAF
ncbi:phage major capsid protein [Streptomyces sp. NPDC051677]|uniref:phage major capsid protein n=1 Tax=Streptomyces sp. NPDC051677 TaxID=3365669 RepID=UPI0037D13A4B